MQWGQAKSQPEAWGTLPQDAARTRGCRKTEHKPLVRTVLGTSSRIPADRVLQSKQAARTTPQPEHRGDGTNTRRLWGFFRRSSSQRMCLEGKGDSNNKKH